MLKSGGYLLFYAVFGLFFLFAVETSAQDTGARWWNMAVTPSPSSEFEVKNTYFAFFNITVDGASGFKLDKGIGINTSTFSKMIKQDLANILYEKKVFYPCRGSCLQMAQSAKAPPLSIRVISRELQWGFWAGKVTYDMTVEFLINGSVVESFEERLVSPGLLTFRNDLRSVIAKRLTNSASLSSSLPSLEKINLEHLQYGEWDKINTSQLTGFTGAMYVPQDDGLGIAAITLGGPMHLLGYSVGDVLTYVEGIGSLIGITNSEFNLKIAKELPQNTLITTVFERGGEVHLGELYFGMDAKLPQQLGYPANWFDEGKRMNVQVVEALQTRSLCQVMPTGTSQAPLNWFILEGDDCMGLKTGEVRMISVDGSREYKGELVDGRMRLGSYTWRNTGRRYEGGFYNSRPYGRGTIVEGSKITFSDNMKDTFMAFNMARGGKLSSFTEGGKRYNLSDGNNDAMQALMTRYLGGEDVSFETQDLANAVMQNQQEQEFLKAERKRQEAAERKQLAAERRRKSQQEDNM
ncbi:MAG: hypothetical protein HOM01_12740, partial [Kordiimonadaceae bacterium]|nr:hypothetical protein [Kordiimonadaceae bacterium]